VYGPVVDPRRLLETLLALYWRGASEPLPLFPGASLAHVEAIRSGRATVDALGKWQEEEGTDSWNVLAFGESGESVSRPEFAAVSEALFMPMFHDTEDPS
jgi:hypothetical protein